MDSQHDIRKCNRRTYTCSKCWWRRCNNVQPRIVSLCRQSCLRILSGFANKFSVNHRFDVNMRFPFYILLSTVVLLCTLKTPPFGHISCLSLLFKVCGVWGMVGAMTTTKLLWRKCFLIVLDLYDLLVFSSGQYSFARCWLIWMQSCSCVPSG